MLGRDCLLGGFLEKKRVGLVPESEPVPVSVGIGGKLGCGAAVEFPLCAISSSQSGGSGMGSSAREGIGRMGGMGSESSGVISNSTWGRWGADAAGGICKPLCRPSGRGLGVEATGAVPREAMPVGELWVLLGVQEEELSDPREALPEVLEAKLGPWGVRRKAVDRSGGSGRHFGPDLPRGERSEGRRLGEERGLHSAQGRVLLGFEPRWAYPLLKRD